MAVGSYGVPYPPLLIACVSTGTKAEPAIYYPSVHTGKSINCLPFCERYARSLVSPMKLNHLYTSPFGRLLQTPFLHSINRHERHKQEQV